VVTHALIHAVRAGYTGEWTSALSSAWSAYLIWLRTQLQAGVDAQRARPAPTSPDTAPFPAPSGASGGPIRPDEGSGSGSLAVAVDGHPDDDPDDDPDDRPDDRLDDEDDGESGYRGLMMSMTLRPKRARGR
jgi:hypothetical protein